MRRARATTATVLPGARCMCPRAVEAPGACAARSGCNKLRTVPAATLQRRPAGARRRRGRQPRGLHDARTCRDSDGGHSAPAPGAAARRGARWAPPARRGLPGGVPSRWPAGRGGRGRLGASELGRRAGELSAVSGGCQRSLTKRVLACEQFAVEMPFSSTLTAAAGATERLRGCTLSRKIALLALSIYVHRGVGRRRLALALGPSHCDCVL